MTDHLHDKGTDRVLADLEATPAQTPRVDIQTMSDDALVAMADEIRRVLSCRRWSVGDRCFWRDRAGIVHQGTVKVLLKTGLLGVAKKGELQWGHAVDPVRATKTLEAA